MPATTYDLQINIYTYMHITKVPRKGPATVFTAIYETFYDLLVHCYICLLICLVVSRISAFESSQNMHAICCTL